MADLTVAVSESAFQRLFVVLRDSIRWEAQDMTNFGPFTAGYHVKGHLEGGSVDFRADNSILIDELDVRWDKFEFTLGLDIPEICVGGGCINMPWPIPDGWEPCGTFWKNAPMRRRSRGKKTTCIPIRWRRR